MRLFIASPAKLDNYASIKEDFKDIIEGKWVKEEHLHLTWVFLGDVADEKPVIDTLQTVSPLESSVNMAELVPLKLNTPKFNDKKKVQVQGRFLQD